MPASTIVTGMVLSAMPVGDYDKRLVLLTTQLGKISVFAKGARRPNSAFLACSQPFAFGEFSLYAGRSSYSIQNCEISNYFPELRNDIESVYYGLYFCEFADHLTKEQSDGKEILKLLYQTLRAITKKTITLSLIRAIFELKIMALDGMAPQVFYCVKCEHGSKDKETLEKETYRFSIESGGIQCASCQHRDHSSIRLSTSTLYAMQYIISSKIEKLYTFTVADEILRELMLCIRRYLERYIDHTFKSLELINTLS